MTLEHVALEPRGRVATLTLNRPDRRNSLGDPLLQDLSHGTLKEDLRREPDV